MECKLFNNNSIYDWMNSIKPLFSTRRNIEDDLKFMKNLNGDINDFSKIIENEGDEKEFNSLKNFLFSSYINCYGFPYHNPDDYELLLNKRATQHINQLFNKYVDDETLVITSSYQHISAEREINKCKNVIKIDSVDNNSNMSYHIDECISKAKKFKKVFAYLIGTEFGRGVRHSNEIYKKLYNLLKINNIDNIMVMDAAQEMFLYPRDYSFYHYIIDTIHSLYTPIDCGLLFINKNLISNEDIETFSCYKRCDVMKRIIRGFEISLDRKYNILNYQSVINDSINHDLFKNFNLHNSQGNFYSMYTSGSFLYNDECIEFITNKFINKALNKDPGVDVQIDYHKEFRELYIRMRAQTLMLDNKDAIEKYNYFYNNYKEFQKLILKYYIK